MAVIQFGAPFRGQVPRLSAHSLPDGAAVQATNTDLGHGDLRGRRESLGRDTPVMIGRAVRSLYSENGTDIFGWDWPVFAVKSMVVDDSYSRIYYTASQYIAGRADISGNFIKVARMKRPDGSTVIGSGSRNPASEPYIANYEPPEYSTPSISGNTPIRGTPQYPGMTHQATGPDSWLLGVPAPQLQAISEDDQFVATLNDKTAWPGSPKLRLKATYFLEDSSGTVVQDTDITGDPLDAKGFPQVIWSESQTDTQAARGNKIQDMNWALGGASAKIPAPFKWYWFLPPDTDSTLDTTNLKRCVKIEGYDEDAKRTVFVVYSSNSSQIGKGNTDQVTGGMAVEMFDFKGDEYSNPVLARWKAFFQGNPAWQTAYDPNWIGFQMIYGYSEERAYVMTHVNQFGEESIPSPATNIKTTMMHDPKLSGIYNPPAPHASGDRYAPITTFRLYRAAVTKEGSFTYLRCPASPKDANNRRGFPAAYDERWGTKYPYSFWDSALGDQLGLELETLDWDAPPIDLMGLTEWRDGMMAAFRENIVYFCEPFRPFAWPGKYAIALPYKVLRLVVDENSLIAITDRVPYQFLGTHPSKVSYEGMQLVQPGLPADPNGTTPQPSRSVCRTPKGVFYASAEGLVHVAGGQARRVYTELWSAEEWRLSYEHMFGRMILAYDNGRLLCFGTGPYDRGFSLPLDDGAQLLTTLEWDSTGLRHVLAVTRMPAISGASDRLIVLREQKVNLAFTGDTYAELYESDFATRLRFRYNSRIVELERPCNMSVLQLLAQFDGDQRTDDDIRVTVYAWPDGASGNWISQEMTVPGDVLYDTVTLRLQSGFKSRRWQVALDCKPKVIIRRVTMAGTPLELRRV